MLQCSHCPKRRLFLYKGFLMILNLGLSFHSGCGKSQDDTSEDTGLPATPVDNSPTNLYMLSFTDYPALQNSGGSVKVIISASSGKKNLYVTRITATSAIAVTTACTHSGCTVGSYNSTTKQYICPCHGSTFNADGSVTSGPAITALQSYTGTIAANGIQLTII